ncbi:hypothetical protein CRG98_022709, partial [Punica granatum]
MPIFEPQYQHEAPKCLAWSHNYRFVSISEVRIHAKKRKENPKTPPRRHHSLEGPNRNKEDSKTNPGQSKITSACLCPSTSREESSANHSLHLDRTIVRLDHHLPSETDGPDLAPELARNICGNPLPWTSRRMTYAYHVINHSRKLRNVAALLRQEHSASIRWFSNSTRTLVCRNEDTVGIHQHGYVSAQRQFVSRHATYSTMSLSTFKKNECGVMVGKMDRSISFSLLNRSHKHLSRGYSSDSGLPPHQEIGMPSLSPTMTEGNIARWLKKEGEKVTPGEVLCEVETDKATVEMECMEEGYLAKIIKGDGSKEIKVGEVIAITVEEEEDIEKFKDYTPSASDAKPVATPEPAPPKPEVAQEPPSAPAPESKVSEPGSAPAGDRIFASPLARKLAEDNNVKISSIKGTGPDGLIVKADVEDYLASRGKEVPAGAPKTKVGAAPDLDYTDIPHSQIRKITASRLLFSKQTIPHYYLTVDTCVDRLM